PPEPQHTQPTTPVDRRPTLSEVLVPRLSQIALKLNPRAQTNDIQLRLAAAGYGKKVTAQGFLALKTVLGLFAIIIGFGAGGVSGRGLAVTIFLLAASHFGPDYALNRRVRNRAERLSAHLPS